MSTRRVDPDRRERIIDCVLELVAVQGMAGTSHRKVAALADVPLGSMTYHFSGMDELLEATFTRFAPRSASASPRGLPENLPERSWLRRWWN